MTDRAQRLRDFQSGLKSAIETADPEGRLSKLARLAAGGAGYLETIQIDRALGAVRTAEQQSHTVVRLAALGSSTIEHLLPAIRVAGLQKQLLIDIDVGQFGQYRQELLNPDSRLATFRPMMILLSLTFDDVVSGIRLSASRAEVERTVRDAVSDLRLLWRTARERFGATVIQQSFLDVTQPLFGNHDRLIPSSPSRLLGLLNDQLATAAAEEGVLLLDLAAASARDGIDAWFDERHWLQGKIEVAPGAARRYGELLARLIGAQFGRSKKCLVLDLDNTLWGGVIGDDGPEGVRLGQGSAAGEAHLALQKYAKQLKERGVILAVCSKNDWASVEEMFDRHPEMLLRRADIASFAVNWADKADNLRSIAAELNLSLDSLVFVDDSAVERARIRNSLPMVSVPELPDDAAYYVRSIAQAGYFEATVLTDEDRQRSVQYAANIEREALRGASQGVEDFLSSLQMSVAYGPLARVDLVRAGQLINKTNQFNTTTRRMTGQELEEWASSPTGAVLQFRLLDRFGDNGLVSVILLREYRDHVLELANWVMSCRVFGRQLEHEAMNIAVEAARERGARAIEAAYVPTTKNSVVRDLFGNLGFRRLEEDAAGVSRWRLEVAEYRPHTTYIRRLAQNRD
jgi:FkbH-like protein